MTGGIDIFSLAVAAARDSRYWRQLADTTTDDGERAMCAGLARSKEAAVVVLAQRAEAMARAAAPRLERIEYDGRTGSFTSVDFRRPGYEYFADQMRGSLDATDSIPVGGATNAWLPDVHRVVIFGCHSRHHN